MIPIDQTSFHHQQRRHSSISHHHPPSFPPYTSSSPSSASPPLTFDAVSSSPLTNDPIDPTCEEDKRSAHNALERQRREGLNSKFQQLAHALPGLQNIRRPSKSMIVGKSLEFVTRSVQRDSSYKNKIRQLRKEHDTLRKHTQRSQQYLKKRMNAEEEENNKRKMMMRTKSDSTTTNRRNSSSSNDDRGASSTAAVAVNDGGKKKASPDQQKQQHQQKTPDMPVIKRHKTRSSSSLAVTKKNNTPTTTSVLHKFIHHHASSSNTHEKPSFNPLSATPPRQHHGKYIHTPLTTTNSTTTTTTTTPTPTTITSTENTDPSVVVMTPQQQSRYTHAIPAPNTSMVVQPTESVFPIQVSWPPLDLSALQPPQTDEGLALYSPADLFHSLSNNPTTTVFGGTSSLPQQTCSTVTTATSAVAEFSSNIPNYFVPSTYPPQPDSTYSHHGWK
ncbi:hypothetical protein BCR42DRAFT_449388 [Absidia repens]|uniref:BHLH domain-containing protein n=1 Tax=Absidia repens TaxID=90262 RepID=A0A1X2INU1_9FUNG|nr:hypothetical protein BCR42DRAFT_449388 [Absidia repens]